MFELDESPPSFILYHLILIAIVLLIHVVSGVATIKNIFYHQDCSCEVQFCAIFYDVIKPDFFLLLGCLILLKTA